MKACAQPGCPKVVHKGRCPAHVQGGWDRRPRAERGYGSAWDSLRQVVLRRDGYLCQAQYHGCTTQGTQVDHITPRSRGGSDGMDNLRAICASCHMHKTQREGRNKFRGIRLSRKVQDYVPALSRTAAVPSLPVGRLSK